MLFCLAVRLAACPNPGPGTPPAGARRTSLLPVSGSSSWCHALFCHAARLARCDNLTWYGPMRSALSCSAYCKCSSHVSRHRRRQHVAPCSFFIATYAYLLLLPGPRRDSCRCSAPVSRLRRRRQHVAISSILSQHAPGRVSSFHLVGAHALCTLLQCLLQVRLAACNNRGPGALHSPAAPHVRDRRTSLVPVAHRSRWRRALFCGAVRPASCPNPTCLGTRRSALSCKCSAHVSGPRRRRQQVAL